ncbi:Scd6-like Sm domain-containing protein [Lipomyces tetrasporus]|uniref:Scd6-like Sm domain-containing protein n=1 Tax=Lipomyces tetrasporus TaxID=54092 RepID=A0AAD7QTC4_9ASCO|nr:Scd6-like Sm domain-containing protein [Lipomyces tetrasporus]KAJ8099362.1 Scd6-like Sm domain-containing protein [Lipomyces tetrasporus]
MSQYIGSRISLFSNSDIRYVGVLHEIDADASTLTLKDVRSFGTEGRRGNPSEEIPATDNVYEFIVFRGSEVKDLVIEEEEEAPQPSKQSIPDDPAIIQSAAPPAGFRPPPPRQYPPPQPQQGFVPPYYPQQPFVPYPPQAQYDQSQVPVAAPIPPPPTVQQQRAPIRQPAGPPSQPATIPPVPARETKPDIPPVQPAGRINVVPAVPVPKARQVARQHAAPTAAQVNLEQAHNAAQDLLEKLMLETPSDAAPAAASSTTVTPTTITTITTTDVPTGPARGNISQRGFRQNGAQRYNYNNFVRHGAGPRTSRLDVPASDFNFEESNAKFRKDTIAKEVSVKEEDDAEDVNGEESESMEVFYDKSSSFFDNISSGTKERFEGNSNERLGRQQERQLNMETFGQASVDTGRYRGRGRGRGRGGYYGRGRGGHGPRGGFRSQGALHQPEQQQA